ncbi:hypothetical protein G7Z12_03075 [Streptomyces sp. ID38640]|nr:hypothetical protein G7Z12_03075 [Streptomyces sp. ID38640]
MPATSASPSAAVSPSSQRIRRSRRREVTALAGAFGLANPWFGFSNVSTGSAHTLDAFPSDFSKLPTVSFVVPNLCSDMHDCSVSTGDTWLKNHLKSYADWAWTHNSLLLLTFDEDNRLSGNRIPTVLYGRPVQPGSTSSTTYNHYDVLRTLEDMYGTSHAGHAADAKDISGIWAG